MKKLLFIFLLQLSFLYAQTNMLIPFSINKKIGFINEELRIIVEPIYDKIDRYKDNTFILYNSYKNVYVLQSQNEQKNIQDIILLGKGYYSMYFDPDTYIYDDTGKRIRVLSKLQHDHNASREFLIVFNGARENIIKQDDTYVFSDKNILEIFDFEPITQTALCRYKGRGMCLVTEKGVINQEKYSFSKTSFNEGLVFGKNNKTGETGFYNMNCKLVIKATVKEDSTMDDWDAYPSVNCGAVALVKEGENNIILSNRQRLFSENWNIVDNKGNVFANGIKANYISPFSDNVAVLMLKNGNKWIYELIDKHGHCLTETEFDEIHTSINGYCMARKDDVDYLISSGNGSVYKCTDFK